MAFREAEIEVLKSQAGLEMIEEYEKLERLADLHGDNHGYTFVCQVFAHKTYRDRFFLTGRVLEPEQSKALAEILKK